MKKRHLLLVLFALLSMVQARADVVINETNFPDANFRNYLLSESYGSDGVITDAEIASIYTISVVNKGIQSLEGIKFFTALKELDCIDNQLTALDVSKNTALTRLDCTVNQLTALDVSKNTALERLICEGNQLTALDVSECTALKELECDGNQLTALNVSGCTALETLNCSRNQLTTIDISKNTLLTELNVRKNQLTALDVSKNTLLEELRCHNNQLTALDLSKNTALTYLNCNNNQLTSLDVSKNTALTYLDCNYNQLTALNISGCTALEVLVCDGNQLTALDVSKNTALELLLCYNNQLTSLDVSGCTALYDLYCHQNQIKGAAMDALVSGLPTQSYDASLSVIYYENEGNVMTTTQVAAAKAKGWTPKYSDGTDWKEYAGSDPTAIKPITKKTTVAFGGTSGVDESTDLSNTAVNDVLYTLNNTAGNGYDNTDQSITITSVVSDADIAEAEALTPGTPEFAAKFNGMTIELTAGEGSVTFDCQTIGNRVLTVKMGTAPAATYAKLERGEVKVAYNVAAPTYMHIYATAVAGSRGSKPTTVENALKLYGFTVKPGDTTGIGVINSDKPIDGSDVYFDLSGRRVMTPQKGVYVKNGKKVVVK